MENTLDTVLDKSSFRTVMYGHQKLFFDKRHGFHLYFKHKRRTRLFPFYQNILEFLQENPEVSIYFTLDHEVQSFRMIGKDILINMDAYQAFCCAIQNRTTGRIKAFLGKNISIDNISVTDEERAEFVRKNISPAVLAEVLNQFSESEQRELIGLLPNIFSKETTSQPLVGADIAKALAGFTADRVVSQAVYDYLPSYQVETLKQHRQFLLTNLDKNEKFIQDWLDEDDRKFKRERCLIFGLEYVDPRREGSLSGKKFDILAEHDLEHHVLIELKSPNATVFDITERVGADGGKSTDYSLSSDLARAIPQILGYRRWYECASAEEIQAIGVVRKKIRKCIVVIGQRIDDDVWKEHFSALNDALSGVEIVTYTDLIDKLANTISNIEALLPVNSSSLA